MRSKMDVKTICKKAKEAANKFAGTSSIVKDGILNNLASSLSLFADEIIMANKNDLIKAREKGRNDAFIDRLYLDRDRINQMIIGIQKIVKLDDPVGEKTEKYELENGIVVEKVRAPLGVIGIIFEARPNVAVDAAALCIKSGNGVILRGSKDSSETVSVLVKVIKKALESMGVSPDLVGNIDSSNRSTSVEMLKQAKYIDVVIPRGGESLKKIVLENAQMAVIASAGGNCHTYIAKSADFNIAKRVVVNAKTSRAAVCNALETLLIDKSIANNITSEICRTLKEKGVEIRISEETSKYYSEGKIIAMEEMYDEYDDLIVKVHVVSGIDEAIAHINEYGTNHSEAIISKDSVEIEKFMREVDSCALYANASTRFTDGFELGLGAEMGISTQKLHVRGPIGLKELTSVKYCMYGNGQIRN